MYDTDEVTDAAGKDHTVAPAGDKLGYAITYIQDYGSGRQVQINFGLKPGAPKEAFDAEFDKLRKVTDRQKAHMTLRDTEAKLGAERKMASAIEAMISDSEKHANETLKTMETAPKNTPTVEKQQRLNMVEQARAYKQNKMIELQQHQTNIAIAEAVIEGARKEIED